MLGWLFGGSSAANKVVDTAMDSVKGIGNFIDEQSFTEEEQAKHKGELIKQHTDFLRLAYDQNSIRSITRRAIAWAITGVFLACFITATILAILDYNEAVTKIIELVKVFWLGEIMLAVVAFYFGSQVLRK